VEQNARAALEIASHAYVLETGQVRLSGSGDEVRRNKDIKKLYLGELIEGD
jgi:branched-chain amino acid transport system ATP-binding protein